MSRLLHRSGRIGLRQAGAISYRTLIALGLLVAVVVGLLLWYVPPAEKDYFTDLTEPTRTAARVCSVELRLSREQAANFVSQIKDGRFSLGSELKQSSGVSDYQGCLDRRLGIKTLSVRNEVTAAEVLERAKAYEELFHEYKTLRDQIDERDGKGGLAKADAVAKQLTETKRDISSSAYATYSPVSAEESQSNSATSASRQAAVSAVPPDVLNAWTRCIESSSPPTTLNQSSACSEIVAAGVNKQLTAAVGLARFADSVYVLRRPIDWRPTTGISAKLDPVHVPAGFVVTFNSIPRSFWSKIRPDGDAALAAIIHDYLYWTQSRPRAEADEIFRLALQDSISDRTLVNILYQAVRSFGQSAWNENSKLKASGEKRILKEFPENSLGTWDDWKRRPGVFRD
jgi:uncharacterized protein YjeT (DUF2065 family)